MPKAVVYHNPRCTKSKETLALVRAQVDEVEVVEYLQQPLDKAQLDDIFQMLDIQSAHQMVRSQESEYEQSGLSESSNNDDILAAIAKYPILLERPIVIYRKRAAIGRNLDHVMALLYA
jgi:arsenate reductase